MWAAGALAHGTNNEAELTAVLRLLQAVPDRVPLEVRIDSQYAMNCLTTWVPGFVRRGWRTSKGDPVDNRHLIEPAVEMLRARDVKFVWVRAHQRNGAGDPLNEFVDTKAQAVTAALRSGRQPECGPGWPQD